MKIVDAKKSSSKTVAALGVRVNRTGRRTYTAEYKSAVVGECDAPRVSVAGVALAHGINANLLRRWIVRQKRELAGTMTQAPAVLLPVSVQRISPSQTASDEDVTSTSTKLTRASAATIEIELYGARIHLRGDVDADVLRAVVDVLSRR
jgi:transposase